MEIAQLVYIKYTLKSYFFYLLWFHQYLWASIFMDQAESIVLWIHKFVGAHHEKNHILVHQSERLVQKQKQNLYVKSEPHLKS